MSNKSNSQKTNKSANKKVGKASKRKTAKGAKGGVPLVAKRAIPRPSMSVSSVTNAKGEDWVRIRGREVMYRVFGQAGFVRLTSLEINPLSAATFPKLSAMASLFEKWKLSGDLRISYVGLAPATRSGNICCVLETDDRDAIDPASLVEALNERFSFATPIWEDGALSFPMRDQAVDWYYTSVGAAVDEKRQTNLARLAIFSADAVTADINTLSGYVYLDYDITFSTFRIPAAVGFTLDNQTVQIFATSGIAQSLILCDDPSHIYGPSGGKYQLSKAVQELTSGSYTTTTRDMIFTLVPNATTPLAARYSVNSTAMDEKSPYSPLVLSSLKRKPPGVTDSGDLNPYCCKQLPDGTWSYQLVPGGPWYPYSFDLADLHGTLTTGDVVISLVYIAADGTSTTLGTKTITNTSAFTDGMSSLLSLGNIVGGFFRYTMTCAFTTTRSLLDFTTIIGAALGPVV